MASGNDLAYLTAFQGAKLLYSLAGLPFPGPPKQAEAVIELINKRQPRGIVQINVMDFEPGSSAIGFPDIDSRGFDIPIDEFLPGAKAKRRKVKPWAEVKQTGDSVFQINFFPDQHFPDLSRQTKTRIRNLCIYHELAHIVRWRFYGDKPLTASELNDLKNNSLPEYYKAKANRNMVDVWCEEVARLSSVDVQGFERGLSASNLEDLAERHELLINYALEVSVSLAQCALLTTVLYRTFDRKRGCPIWVPDLPRLSPAAQPGLIILARAFTRTESELCLIQRSTNAHDLFEWLHADGKCPRAFSVPVMLWGRDYTLQFRPHPQGDLQRIHVLAADTKGIEMSGLKPGLFSGPELVPSDEISQKVTGLSTEIAKFAEEFEQAITKRKNAGRGQVFLLFGAPTTRIAQRLVPEVQDRIDRNQSVHLFFHDKESTKLNLDLKNIPYRRRVNVHLPTEEAARIFLHFSPCSDAIVVTDIQSYGPDIVPVIDELATHFHFDVLVEGWDRDLNGKPIPFVGELAGRAEGLVKYSGTCSMCDKGWQCRPILTRDGTLPKFLGVCWPHFHSQMSFGSWPISGQPPLKTVVGVPFSRRSMHLNEEGRRVLTHLLQEDEVALFRPKRVKDRKPQELTGDNGREVRVVLLGSLKEVYRRIQQESALKLVFIDYVEAFSDFTSDMVMKLWELAHKRCLHFIIYGCPVDGDGSVSRGWQFLLAVSEQVERKISYCEVDGCHRNAIGYREVWRSSSFRSEYQSARRGYEHIPCCRFHGGTTAFNRDPMVHGW